MARYYFPFIAYACSDSAGQNVVGEIGAVVGWAGTGSLTQQYSYINADDTVLSGAIAQFDNPNNIASNITEFNDSSYPNYNDFYTRLLTYLNILTIRNITNYVGNYIKLVSTVNNFYAVSVTTISGSSEAAACSPNYYLFDDSGNSMGSLASGFTGATNSANPLPGFEPNVLLPCITIDSEGTITGVTSAVEFSYYASSPYVRYRCRSVRAWDADPILWLNGVKITAFDSDPYAQDPDGTTGTGGGTGSFDGTGDNIDFPSLPTLSAVDTGFITIFNPSASQLKALANYMWGDLFDIGTWKKIFADPMDAILGMSIVPVAVPDGGSAAVTVGNISTGVSMNRAARQYVEVDCGTLNVNEYWGAYLDYDPFTKTEIYLPYIGTHPLATDDIMNKPVHVKYHIDILSGACCAYVKCGGSVMYSFVGQCSCSIPITGNDWSNVVNGALSIAASIGTMVATGGASAPMAAATIASTAVNSMKPSVEKSGSMGGMGGMLGVQTPYLILTRPRQALPARQNTFTGYPSFITMSLGDCSGYTEIERVHLEKIPATEHELSEIENLLKGGVIL